MRPLTVKACGCCGVCCCGCVGGCAHAKQTAKNSGSTLQEDMIPPSPDCLLKRNNEIRGHSPLPTIKKGKIILSSFNSVGAGQRGGFRGERTKITNFNELDLTGGDGEDITISVNTSTNSPVMAYTLNRNTFPGGTFRLDKNVAPVFKLLATTLYKTNSGGSVELQMTGSLGGDTSIHDEVQA